MHEEHGQKRANSNTQSLSKYFLFNNNRYGLHYMQGYLCYRKMDNIEAVENVTSFSSRKAAQEFMKSRNLPGHTVGRIQVTITFL